jgi:hypothetical protein
MKASCFIFLIMQPLLFFALVTMFKKLDACEQSRLTKMKCEYENYSDYFKCKEEKKK